MPVYVYLWSVYSSRCVSPSKSSRRPKLLFRSIKPNSKKSKQTKRLVSVYSPPKLAQPFVKRKTLRNTLAALPRTWRTWSVTEAHLPSVVSPCRLEESSAALCAQMERLEQEMEQEKKKQRMLEIKLRNSERAREDAENRNRLLEKEMEDFFSTLGDLALGSRTSDI